MAIRRAFLIQILLGALACGYIEGGQQEIVEELNVDYSGKPTDDHPDGGFESSDDLVRPERTSDAGGATDAGGNDDPSGTDEPGGNGDSGGTSNCEVDNSCDEPGDDPVDNAPVDCVAQVSHSSDDGEEMVGHSSSRFIRGDVYLDSTDLEMTYDGWAEGDQLIGMRFSGLDVPAGATITSAVVRFISDDDRSESTSLRISGQASGDARSFDERRYDISNRDRTRAEVRWNNLPSWSTSHRYDSPDLSEVVQEIIDNSSWSRGNALVLIVEGSGQRSAYSYDGNPGDAPSLHVTYIP